MARPVSRYRFTIVIAILFALCAAPAVRAQSTSIRLEGLVWDTAGKVLSGATLSAVNDDTGVRFVASSDAGGQYVFPALPPGTYTVTVKATGLKNVIYRHFPVFSPGTITEDFTFEVSAIDRDIAPRERPKLEESQDSGYFSRRELDALPLLDRNPLVLLAYQPGVQLNGGNEGTSTVNGTRVNMNSIGLDGVAITDPINPNLGISMVPFNPDSIEDIQMVTLGASAEYGQTGGAHFTITSRTGAKKWSGNVYDFVRNRMLNANDWQNNSLAIDKPGMMRDLFGGTASGPVGTKTVVFGNFEGDLDDHQVPRNRYVLTDAAKTGIFQWYTPGTVVNCSVPTNCYDVNGNLLTPNTFNIVANDPRQLGIDPTVAATLAKLPEENNTNIGDGLNTAGYQFNNPTFDHEERITARADRSLNDRHQLFLRANYNHVDATDTLNNADAPYLGEPYGTMVANDWGITAGSNYTFNPLRVNELRVSYISTAVDLNRAARISGPMLLANSWTDPLNPSFPSSSTSPRLEIFDSISHYKGNHQLKYGLEFRRTGISSVNYNGVYPNVTFGLNYGNTPPNSVGPSLQSVIDTTDRTTFDNLYNDLLGRIESVSQTFYTNLTSTLAAGTPANRDFGMLDLAGFFQDDWKIRSNLTLNLGVRYELSTVPKEVNGLQSVVTQAGQLSTSANLANLTVAPGSNWYSSSKKDFAPRLGFAWDITGRGKTIIRGGYGIYYDRLIGAITSFVDQNSYGLSQTVSLYPNSSGTTDVRLADGIPTIAQPSSPNLSLPATRSANIAIMDPNLKTPRVDQYHLTLEKRFWGAVVDIGYVGTRGRNLFEYLNYNQTKTGGDFLNAFEQLQAYRESGVAVPATNTLVKIFGSPLAAINALGGSNLDTGQAGAAAETMDTTYYGQYAAAGVSNFYIRNFPQFDQFLVGSSTGQSWYNAVVASIRASARAFHFRVNYTRGKSFDTMSSVGNAYVSPLDSFNPDSSRAPSDFDRTQVLNVAADFRVPFGRYRSVDSTIPKFIDFLLGGWNIGGLYVRESGPRFSVYSGRQTVFSGVDSFADLSTGFQPFLFKNGSGAYWINSDQAAQFTYPTAGDFGTSGRNAFVGPGYQNLDVAFFKNFRSGETRSVQLRVEAYNALNTPHFGLPDNVLSDTNFGKITTMVGTPRTYQVALRYLF